MDKESKGASGAPWGPGILIALLLGVGTLFIADVPYISDRMQDGALRTEQRFATQDIDARLWQDPLGVVQRARDAAKKNEESAEPALGEPAPHSIATLGDEIRQHRGETLVLAVMVRGGPYPEFVEQRRRARYAVLAGLSESGYAPADSDHLGWIARPQAPAAAARLPAAMPFEWLDNVPPSLYQRWGRASRLKRVLVLWLDDRAFALQPVERMSALAEALTAPQAGESPIPWRIIGPVRSDTLLAMVKEGDGNASPPPAYSRLHFYAATPTVADEILLNASSPPCCRLSERLARSLGIHFVRTVVDDTTVALSLIDELTLRGVNPIGADPSGSDARQGGAASAAALAASRPPQGVCRRNAAGDKAPPSRIAVVSEWDSLYGRSSQQAYRFAKGAQNYCVDYFFYTRGLDGLVPSPGAKDDDGKAASQDAKADNRRKDGSFIERAEGQSQFDYLRRLAKRMHERDESLRLSGGHGLQAIGVLGNDVHDKLLVLQALRPEFPAAVFFTTDLDARYLHPREQEWSRNLIVGSGFGLQLDDRLQTSTPPFRDTYQTSQFFATRLIVDDARRALAQEQHPIASPWPRETSAAWSQEDIEQWLGKPRIFEIGRTEAFEFAGRPAGAPPKLLARVQADPATPPVPAGAAPPCRYDHALDCGDVHPPRSDPAQMPDFSGAWLISAVLLLLWLPVLRTYDGDWHRLTRYLRFTGLPRAQVRRRIAGIVLAAILQLVALPMACAWAWPRLADVMTRNGKPLLFTEGISPWPTEFIRLFVLLLGLYMVLRAWRGLSRNQEAIEDHFFLKAPRDEIAASQARAEPGLPWTTRLANMFRLHAVEPVRLPTEHATGLSPPVAVLWQRHVVQNRLGARLVRTTALMGATLLVSAAVVLAFDEPRYVPRRGELAFVVHETLHYLVLGMLYFVVFFVADATALCVSFLRYLHGKTCLWPEGALRRFEKELAFVDERLIMHWIDLQFVAARTLEVNRLVYYPFILLSLVLLSRSPAFDAWQMPLSAKALAAFGALVAVSCAWALRRAAEGARRAALEEIDRALLRANGQEGCGDVEKQGPCAPTARQLELLRQQAARLERGAFAPYSQQPVLKALLLPFATVGGSTLLEYLSLANL